MQTNDFIQELEKAHPRFVDSDIENNLWSGFSCDFEGACLYEKHLNTLYIDYFNKIDDSIDNLLLNRSVNEIELFITNKLNRLNTVKDLLVNHDKFLYLNDITHLDAKIERAGLGIWDENAEDYKLYGKDSLIRMKQHRIKSQLIYDYLNFQINSIQLHLGFREALSYKNAEDDGWDEDYIANFSCQLKMERICREYIKKSLDKFNDLLLSHCPNTLDVKTIKSREIDKEELRRYFKPQFNGMGNGTINYFDTLVDELENDKNAKEFGQIALMIYESDKMNNRKPTTFSKWYDVFCECVACERKKYDPKDLRNPKENLKKLFNYLR